MGIHIFFTAKSSTTVCVRLQFHSTSTHTHSRVPNNRGKICANNDSLYDDDRHNGIRNNGKRMRCEKMDEWKEEHRNLLLKNTRRKNSTSHRIFIWFGSCVAFFSLRHCDVCFFLCRVIWLWFFFFRLLVFVLRIATNGTACGGGVEMYFSQCTTHIQLLHSTSHWTQPEEWKMGKVWDWRSVCMDFYVPRSVRCQKFAILMYLVVSANIDVEMATTTTSQMAVLPSASMPLHTTCMRLRTDAHTHTR